MNPTTKSTKKQPKTTKEHRKTKSIEPSKTPTRQSLKFAPSKGVSLARILRQFTSNAANESNSDPVSGVDICTSIPNNSPSIPNNSASVTPSALSENSIELITRLCEQLSEGHATASSGTSENQGSSASSIGAGSRQDNTVRISTLTSPTSESSCLVPDSKGGFCATNPTLQRLAYYASVGSQKANSTDENSFKVPEVGLHDKLLCSGSEGEAKNACCNASEGVVKATCFSSRSEDEVHSSPPLKRGADDFEGEATNACYNASEGMVKATCFSAPSVDEAHSSPPLERGAAYSKGEARRTTCFDGHSASATKMCVSSAQSVSSDKESRLREEHISRLKEFVQNKEREVERIKLQLHSLEERKASLALAETTSTLINNSAQKRRTLHSHGSGPVSKVSKIRSRMSAKKVTLQGVSEETDQGKLHAMYSATAFLPSFKEKGFLELLGLEVVVESMQQRTEEMSRTN